MSPELESLARELDELGKTPARREPDVPPDFGGTDWRLVRKIGHGTMGTVYEAEQISLARKVAIKVLPMAVSSSPSRRRPPSHSGARGDFDRGNSGRGNYPRRRRFR